jgi:hypothetical protein
MARDRLAELIHATTEPAPVTPYAIPRKRIEKRKAEPVAIPNKPTNEEPDEPAKDVLVSPVAVLFVIAMLGVVFAAILQL